MANDKGFEIYERDHPTLESTEQGEPQICRKSHNGFLAYCEASP